MLIWVLFATTATQVKINGKTISIGSSTSKCYINGNLNFYEGSFYKCSNAYANAISMQEFISQIKKYIYFIDMSNLIINGDFLLFYISQDSYINDADFTRD